MKLGTVVICGLLSGLSLLVPSGAFAQFDQIETDFNALSEFELQVHVLTNEQKQAIKIYQTRMGEQIQLALSTPGTIILRKEGSPSKWIFLPTETARDAISFELTSSTPSIRPTLFEIPVPTSPAQSARNFAKSSRLGRAISRRIEMGLSGDAKLAGNIADKHPFNPNTRYWIQMVVDAKKNVEIRLEYDGSNPGFAPGVYRTDLLENGVSQRPVPLQSFREAFDFWKDQLSQSQRRALPDEMRGESLDNPFSPIVQVIDDQILGTTMAELIHTFSYPPFLETEQARRIRLASEQISNMIDYIPRYTTNGRRHGNAWVPPTLLDELFNDVVAASVEVASQAMEPEQALSYRMRLKETNVQIPQKRLDTFTLRRFRDLETMKVAAGEDETTTRTLARLEKLMFASQELGYQTVRNKLLMGWVPSVQDKKVRPYIPSLQESFRLTNDARWLMGNGDSEAIKLFVGFKEARVAP